MIELSIWELLFWGLLQAVVIAVIVKRLFPKMKVSIPVIMWKSKNGLDKVAALAKKHTKWWKAYGDFGIILAFGLIGALYVFRKRKKHKWLYSLLASLFLLAPSLSNFIVYLLTGNYFLSTNTLFVGNLGEQVLFQAILLGFGFSISVLLLIVQSSFTTIFGYLTGAAVQAAVAPALPGIAIEGSPFTIPWYGWLAFPILIFVHELSHGILTKAEGLKLKATGLLMLGIAPLGAFVEPDEKQLKKAPAHSQMRVYAVGSAANYLTSFLVLGLFVLAINPLLGVVGYYDQYNNYYDHPTIGGVVQSSDGFDRLTSGMKIVSINGTNIASINELHEATSAAGPNALLMIQTDEGLFDVRLNNESMIGVTGLQDTFKDLPLWMGFVSWCISLLGLIAFFNFIVGVMNLLPMYPLDGGLMLESLISTKKGKKTAQKIMKVVSVIVLVLLLTNMLPLFFPA